MRIDDIKSIIQSAHINFMFGSGLSRPYLSTLGNIEQLLTSLNNSGLDNSEDIVIRCSIINEYLRGVICKNLQEEIDIDKNGLYRQTINNYNLFLRDIGTILSQRHMNLCNKTANIFTTNIDMLVEEAIRNTSLEFNDGFEGRNPARFNDNSFSKQASKVSLHLQKTHELPTINYVKLHGSINWVYEDGIVADDLLKNITKIRTAFDELPYLLPVGQITKQLIDSNIENNKPEPTPSELISHFKEVFRTDGQTVYENLDDSLCKAALAQYSRIIMVNPQKSKFRETVIDLPFYELMRLYSNALERQNSVLFVAGFSFTDEHIRLITTRAANNNPTLQVLVFAYSKEEKEKMEKILNISRNCHNNNILVLCPETYKQCNPQKEGTNKVRIKDIDNLSAFDLYSIDKFVFAPIIQTMQHL